MPTCNTTLEDSIIAEDALWKGFTFHHIGLFLAALFGLISVIISLWLIYMHATHYLRPNEQKNIIRIVFMIPVYSVVSFLSYLFYKHAVYYEVLRDCYEAFAISSFFALLCFYIAPDLHEQKEYFRTIQPQNWLLGVFWLQKCTGGENKGPFRKPRSGLTWFNVIWAGIFQYCFVRVFCTIVSVISQALGRYCSASLSPAFAHIWVLAFECISVTVAMFMVIQFYIQLKNDLSEHKPFLKVLSIKLVIFFSFWQTIVISLLSSANGPLQPTKHLAYQDIEIGIPSIMLCIEMAGFSVMHIFAYSWKPYSIKHMKDPIMAPDMGSIHGDAPQYKGGFMGVKAIADAFNPWDIIKSIARGFRWLFVGVRKRHNDTSYHPTKVSVDNTPYMGPSYAATGDLATELRPSYENRSNRGRAGTLGADGPHDDRAGLLGYSQAPGRASSSSPYRRQGPDDYAPGDVGALAHSVPAQHRQDDSLHPDIYPNEWDEDDHGYHPGMGPAPGISAGPSENFHPTSNGHSPQPPGWNHWGGVSPESLGRLPTTYSSNDPRR